MKNIQIKDFFDLHGKASTVVPADAALNYVVALLGHERNLQGIFMVDSDQKYLGMVSRIDLLKWTQYQLYGGSRKADVRLSEVYRLIFARKAKDIATPNSKTYFVKETHTLQDALDLMIIFEEDIIPVLDENGRIIGDLSLSEILAKSLEWATLHQP